MYAPDHWRHPDRIIVATESFPLQSYDNWVGGVWNHSYVIGDFIWTAMDYIGESAIGSNGVYSGGLEACEGHCEMPFPYHVS